MAGNQIARILDAKMPLHRRFEQVPRLRNNRQYQRQNSSHQRSGTNARIGEQRTRGNPPGRAAEPDPKAVTYTAPDKPQVRI